MTEKLYEDGEIKILLEGKRVIVMPFEPVKAKDLSEEVFSKIGAVSTLCSAILFETLGAQGTNIVMNDDSQFSSHIIPRVENDGINFQWDPKNMDEATIKDVKSKIADALFEAPKEEKVSPEPEKLLISDKEAEVKEKSEDKTEDQESDETKVKEAVEDKPINYILRSLKRRP